MNHKKAPTMKGFELVVIGQLMLIAQLPQSALALAMQVCFVQNHVGQQRVRVRDL